jgi:NAD(P)-dependent dehydrogenase (short-subunit alcohol dehydrogenase family)
MTIGGNWKDLVKAAGNGDMPLAKYHLGGIDTNFQHPEYFTAPIFEAIRGGHLDMVRLLVEEGKANPELIEELTDSTPIELALEEGQHDIVDYLNTVVSFTEAQWKPKQVLVTGGNRGIGKAICLSLLQKGHRVVFTCRSKDVGDEVLQELKDTTNNSKVKYLVGDLSSIAATNELVDVILEKFPELNVLVHNAGIWPTEKVMTEDGLELAFTVNYIAPYIMNQRLYPILEKNGPSRIVLVTAGFYVFGKADISKTPYGTDFGPLASYRNTKQCGMIHHLHLARQRNDEKSVSINAVHPGVIQTGLGTPSNGCLACLLRAVKTFCGKPSEGAVAPVWLAVSPEAEDVHGQYYHGLQPQSTIESVSDASVQEEWSQWTEDFLARKRREAK